jgi:bacterioferritin
MGKKGKEIVSVDTKKLIKSLNEALSEEWLAYYQYWIGTKVMEGPMRSEIVPELIIHANQELNHATLVTDRIIQLGGIPILDPKDWSKHASCAYEAPEDPYVEVILQQNLRGERCAISRYKGLADLTIGKDYATYQMVMLILNEEIEHEQDIEEFLRDIERMREDFRKLKMKGIRR